VTWRARSDIIVTGEESYLTNDGEVRAERALAFHQSAAPHRAPQEVLAPEDDLRAARGILLAILLGTVIWAGVGAAVYFIVAF
jgi:hypothetical protein